jgi:hypothetical protein
MYFLVGLSKAAVLLLSLDERMLTDLVQNFNLSVATSVALLRKRACFRIVETGAVLMMRRQLSRGDRAASVSHRDLRRFEPAVHHWREATERSIAAARAR